VTGVVLAALAALAVAAPASAGSASVTFSGSSPLGLAALACASNPDKGSLSLTTDDTLSVRNTTGHSAYVYLNGSKTSHQVGNDQGVPITFPAGHWSVSLVPSCLLNLADAASVSVTVVQATRDAAPATTPATTHAPAPAPTHTNAPQPKPTHTTAQPRNATPTPTPTRTPTPTPSAVPSTAAASIAGTTGSTGTTGGSSGSSKGGTAAGGSTTGTDGSTVADGSSGQVNIGIAQALPASDSQPATPSYLLAVIALISILGVGSASVRAFNSQRRTRRAAY
jgi:hypothetical protein